MLKLKRLKWSTFVCVPKEVIIVLYSLLILNEQQSSVVRAKRYRRKYPPFKFGLYFLSGFTTDKRNKSKKKKSVQLRSGRAQIDCLFVIYVYIYIRQWLSVYIWPPAVAGVRACHRAFLETFRMIYLRLVIGFLDLDYQRFLVY